jgi:uncharacterized protein (TIGR02284 family)
MDRTRASLTELLEALIEGMGWFDLAAEHSRRAACIQLFHQIRRLKAHIAAELIADLSLADLQSESTGPDTAGAWLAAYRQACAGLPDRLANGPEPDIIAALEAQEIRLARAFRDAIGRDRPAHLRELAATFLPEVEQARDHLHALHRHVAH